MVQQLKQIKRVQNLQSGLSGHPYNGRKEILTQVVTEADMLPYVAVNAYFIKNMKAIIILAQQPPHQIVFAHSKTFLVVGGKFKKQ